MLEKLVRKYFILLVIVLACCPKLFAQQDVDEEFTDNIAKSIEENTQSKPAILSGEGYDVMTRIENIGNGHPEGLVIVEPRNLIPVNGSNKLEMVSYSSRRKKWGQLWGLSYGLYKPSNYELDGIEAEYDEYYPSGLGLIQVEGIYKRNFDTFSIGGYLSVGYFNVSSDVENFESDLSVMPLKLGFYFSLDTLWREPWVVPYVHGGIYTIYFDETSNGSTLNGTTLVSYYATGGLMMQLDWADDSTAREAYIENGIENTFLFVEANYMAASIEEQDPDFNAIYVSGGLKLEF